METKEFQTYELVPPLNDKCKVIFEDYKSAQKFAQVLEEEGIGDIEPVFLDNSRWKQIKENCEDYPDEYYSGTKFIVPNPRRGDRLTRTQDKTLWNRYNEFTALWNVVYLGYFTDFGIDSSLNLEGEFDRERAKRFEMNAWLKYLRESEKFKIENNFNWAYIERVSPGTMYLRIIKDCHQFQIQTEVRNK